MCADPNAKEQPCCPRGSSRKWECAAGTRSSSRPSISRDGEVLHVLNRTVSRRTIFRKPADYDAFVQVLGETWQIVPLPIFSMVAMPNHWHFVVRPTSDDQVSEFFRRLSVMYIMRYHAHYKTNGTGPIYQGRFKSLPIQSDQHLLVAMRYVERNPVRANFVELAVEWQ